MKEMLRKFWKAYKNIRMFGLRGIYFSVKQEILTAPKEVTVTAPGVSRPIILRLKTSDIETYEKIFPDGEYEVETLQPPKTIIDAGANIGLASIYFTNRFPEAKIIAVEPEESNFLLLKKNTIHYQNIIPLHAALWRDNLSVDLIDTGLGKWGFQTQGVNSGNASKENCRIQGLTVDKIMQEYGIDYVDILKIDIEGAEKEVFEDPSKWIDKIGLIIIELHERLKSGCNRSFYNATNNFELEWMQGENIFLARKGMT